MHSNNGSSTDGQPPLSASTPAPSRHINHRVAQLFPFRPLVTPKAEEKPVAPAPVIDERLEENDLRLSVHVKLNGRTESLADITMERMIAEGKMEKNRWVLLKAVEDLIATACQGTALKLEAKLGVAAQPGTERHAGEDLSFEHDFPEATGSDTYRIPEAAPRV